MYKAKFPKRHYPVMHLLKVEGATCAPGSVPNNDLYIQQSPTPRSSISSTQISSPIGSSRSFGTKRRVVFRKTPGDGW